KHRREHSRPGEVRRHERVLAHERLHLRIGNGQLEQYGERVYDDGDDRDDRKRARRNDVAKRNHARIVNGSGELKDRSSNAKLDARRAKVVHFALRIWAEIFASSTASFSSWASYSA